MTETLANGYSSESTKRELSNEYQHDRVWVVIKDICILCASDESSQSIGRVKDLGLIPGKNRFATGIYLPFIIHMLLNMCPRPIMFSNINR